MDSPTLSLKTILNSARIAENGKAHIVPANDGGYVLLSLPSKISPSVFENVGDGPRIRFPRRVNAIRFDVLV